MNTIKLKDATITDVSIEHDLSQAFMSDHVECLYDVTLTLNDGTLIAIESYSERCCLCGITSVNDLFFHLVHVDNTERTFAEVFMDAFWPNIYGGCIMTITKSNQHEVSFKLKSEVDDNINSVVTSPDYPGLNNEQLLETISSHLKKGELQSTQSSKVYYLLHSGLYRKDFHPLVFDNTQWQETDNLIDATFFMDKQVAEEARIQALHDEQGTNWYDRDVVIVALRGDCSLDTGAQLDVTDFIETNYTGYYALEL